MESLVFLIYSNTVVTILVALCIAFGIALLLQRFAKVSNLNSAVFSIGVVVYFAIMFSPTPAIVDRQIINMMELLEQNKVDSNGTINSVLFPCLDREIRGVRGLHVQDIQEAFLKDIQDQSILNGLDSKMSFKPKSDDLCEAAWHYNEVKAKRLELIKK